jgi:hypothetical protein
MPTIALALPSDRTKVGTLKLLADDGSLIAAVDGTTRNTHSDGPNGAIRLNPLTEDRCDF